MPTININSIEPGTTVYIDGIVDYSRIASRIEGAELEADNAKKISRRMQPVDKPHTRLTVRSATVAYEKGIDAAGNPIEPTLAEQFIAEKLYQSTLHPNKGLCYTGMNKTKNLPEIYCRENSASKMLEPVEVGNEIAVGTKVTLAMRFFATNQNNGVSLDAVIVNQKPVPFSNNGSIMASALAARGFQVVPASAETADAMRAQLNSTPAPESPVPPVAAPYMQPAPAAPAAVAPAPVPAPAPAAVAPAPAAVAPAPVAPAPVPAAVAPAPVAPAAPATAAPAPAANAPSLPIPPKGYTYDESGRLVPENAVAAAPAGGIRL